MSSQPAVRIWPRGTSVYLKAHIIYAAVVDVVHVESNKSIVIF